MGVSTDRKQETGDRSMHLGGRLAPGGEGGRYLRRPCRVGGLPRPSWPLLLLLRLLLRLLLLLGLLLLLLGLLLLLVM